MIKQRLLLIEGLPGSGKSTNSRIIMSKIEETCKRVRWIHEVARPHSTLFFNEVNLTLQEYNGYLKQYPLVEPILEKIKKCTEKQLVLIC